MLITNCITTYYKELIYFSLDTSEEMTKERILVELEKRNIRIQNNSIYDYSDDDLSELKELYRLGKLTEKLNATTRLCFIPDEKKEC